LKKLFILFLAVSLLIFSACSGEIIEKITENPFTVTSIDNIEFIEEIDIRELNEEMTPFAREISEIPNMIYKTVGDRTLKFDLYFPTEQKFEKTPLVVGFHGGGWIAGDKSNLTRQFAPIIYELRANGYAFATVEYRLADEDIIYPAPFDDCVDFISAIKQRAREYNIDPDNIGVLGYSAGAHLAMLCSYALDLDLRYCVSFAGPAKLYGDNPANYPNSTMRLVESLFGGSYEEREDLYKSGSPYFYLEQADYIKTPLLLVHDESDAVVPFNQSVLMYEKAVSLEIDSALLELQGAAHDIEFNSGSMFDPPQEEAMRVILNFIYKFYKNY
jgi:acetyl esterase/lipase